jgi:hypothetical protein
MPRGFQQMRTTFSEPDAVAYNFSECGKGAAVQSGAFAIK